MEIEKMNDWDILLYLRYNRSWLVLSCFTREEIEEDFGFEFDDIDDWIAFTESSCDGFENVRPETLQAFLERYEMIKDENEIEEEAE